MQIAVLITYRSSPPAPRKKNHMYLAIIQVLLRAHLVFLIILTAFCKFFFPRTEGQI